jgi:ribose 5-phosphate isomerase B
MPSWELFEKQDAAYRESVLPSAVTARVSVEMAATTGWERYVGPKGKAIGMHSFGASAPLKDVLKKFGFLPERVAAAAKKFLESEQPVRLVIGSDHAGFQLKVAIGDLLRSLGHEVLDVGAFNENPSDYPDFAEAVGRAVVDKKAERGVLICGSGVGASVAANKIPGVRAGMCHDTYSAHQGVEHDDINILVLGSRVIGVMLAQDLVKAFLGAKFTNEERHVRRLGKVKAIEAKYAGARKVSA